MLSLLAADSASAHGIVSRGVFLMGCGLNRRGCEHTSLFTRQFWILRIKQADDCTVLQVLIEVFWMFAESFRLLSGGFSQKINGYLCEKQIEDHHHICLRIVACS